jgi:hypothetical protein
MFDVPSNNKICYLRAHTTQTAGSANQLELDLQEVNDQGLNERTTDLLVIVEVSDANGGTLSLIAQDSQDGTTWDADFATTEDVDADGLAFFVIRGIRQYFRLRTTVASATMTWGAVGIGLNAQRRPVKQTDGTELTVTYASDREG